MFQHTAARRRLDIVLVHNLHLLRFQHTAARRRLGLMITAWFWKIEFQHTAARRRLETAPVRLTVTITVSTHSRPKAAGMTEQEIKKRPPVSTHSRPKAAGCSVGHFVLYGLCFNTQPPEGGWLCSFPCSTALPCFNTQPPEGGWGSVGIVNSGIPCFNTQPPEGGWRRVAEGKTY